ncbi:MAG: TonB-dependent receptor, partial [Muribaculaceae bacterium]|nr:TonB-dependent receptor [Muribaculaceae bacterium]
ICVYETDMDLMVGYETYNLERESVTAIGYNLYDPTGWFVDNTIDRRMGYGSRDIEYTTRGILARAKYNYAQRYFGHVSYRRDSSSRFAPGHRWGDFFSVSAAWDIAKESFMDPARNVVDQLKFKASFGQNGNDNLGTSTAYYYAWQDQYKITGADGVWNDATLAYKGNKNITWEKSNAFNVGFDFSLLQGKLDGSIEYYQRQVSDMLFFLPTAPSLGYDQYPANVGSMRNNGFEIELNYNVFNTPDFSWTINANLTTGGNKIISLPKELVKDGQWINGSRLFKEGHSMYNLLLVEYAGVDEATGEALYWAKMNDGSRQKTTDFQACYSGNTDKGILESRTETGNLMPKIYGGFGTSLYLYGVEFSLTFAYQAGGRLLDYTYQDLMHNGDKYSAGKNFHVDALNRWTPENTKTNVPRIDAADNYTNSTSTRFLISSNYLSLNNVTLAYTLPGKLTRQIGIESVRIYGAAENVALWTKRRGLDPRQSYLTSENSTYSPMRTISGGIRVQF